MDHLLFHGPPGLGKTTLAQIVARELGVNFRMTSGPVIARPGDLAAVLTNLEPRDVLFIDEIHRLSPVVEEILYPAMEDFELDLVIGEGPAARTVRIDLAPFTLIGATTRLGLLTTPLRDRFGIPLRLEFYTEARAARDRRPRGAADGAGRRAGRPGRDRPARARDAAHRQPAAAPRRRLRRRRGRRPADARAGRRGRWSGWASTRWGWTAPTGGTCRRSPSTTAAARSASRRWRRRCREARDAIEEVIEPYLMQAGMIARTPRGRVLTAGAWRHLGLEPPRAARQSDLFGEE